MPCPVDLNDPNRVTQSGKDYIDKIGEIQSKIYNNEKTVPLERELVNAINLIASSFDYENKNIRLIQLMFAIEALVEKKNNKEMTITEQVSKIPVLLLGKDCSLKSNGKISFVEKYHEICNRLKDLYDKRSKISHGDGNTANVTDYDIFYLEGIAKDLCFYFYENFNKFYDSNNHPKRPVENYISKLEQEIPDSEK